MDLSQVYTVKDIQAMLKLSKNTTYALIKSGAFEVIKIGDTYRVSKEVFENWVNGRAS